MSSFIAVLCALCAIVLFQFSNAFIVTRTKNKAFISGIQNQQISSNYVKGISLEMGFLDDAFRFFSNLNKEASAKHILIKGPDASKKLILLKAELVNSTNISEDFSKLALKVTLRLMLQLNKFLK